MSERVEKNRDRFLKFCFKFFIEHILKVMGIDEEIVEIMPSEQITFKKIGKRKIFDSFLDFHAVTKSGKILVFEFKKNPLTKKDLKQAFKYYDTLHCKEKADVKLIIILLSKGGRIKEYTESDVTYHPQMIRTKKISKQKPLSIIRDKLQHNRKLTDEECSLLITLPLFNVKESEADLTEEICGYISEKKHCIPRHLYDEMVLAMYLNIEEYVDDEKEKKLLEMINMGESYQGVISEIRNEGRKDGRLDAERDFIKELLQTFTLEEISKFLHREKSEIEKILRR